ncbi:hypothetical protein FOG18_10245 [Legionella israelensis]|uniref:hypothetical protein n=1 Tax=Legionella israelensis TaxID=454 RepID=UPI00117CFB37|nr:hypothetical protein [Legionella israelensis]QDP72914.1 hypothetical protein FOG18_10245 [Legionella israelensis]
MKNLLLEIARLPKKHQLWIIKHLPDELRKGLVKKKGLLLLKQARHFAKIKAKQQVSLPVYLPEMCKSLNKTSELFTAIILYEGQFSWAEDFLKQHPHQEEQVRIYLAGKVKDIKPTVRQTVFQQWTKKTSFAEFIEVSHG